MKRFLFLIMAIVCATYCSRQVHNSENLAAALFTANPVVIDGSLNEQAWTDASRIYLKDNNTGQVVEDSSYSVYASVCYDKINLYIAFLCNDVDIFSSYTERDQHLWEEEAIEVFIDVDDEPNTYVEIELSPNNVLFDSYIVDPVNIDVEETAGFDLPGIETAVSVNGTVNKLNDQDSGWSAEIRIPFADLVKDFKFDDLKKAEWKINFYRLDRDHDGPSSYAWSPTFGRFHKPSVFGSLVFK
ncbi:carbohydrate-binding family 9-like protein [candidate division KSB1 bacterium]|nr:carbohydrate-binding family 9-like protein [candidate division KSB1 bacterium]